MSRIALQDKIELGEIPRGLRRQVSAIFKANLERCGDVYEANQDTLDDDAFLFCDAQKYKKIESYLAIITKWASMSHIKRATNRAMKLAIREGLRGE